VTTACPGETVARCKRLKSVDREKQQQRRGVSQDPGGVRWATQLECVSGRGCAQDSSAGRRYDASQIPFPEDKGKRKKTGLGRGHSKQESTTARQVLAFGE